MTLKNVPLAERRADLRVAVELVREHKSDCIQCRASNRKSDCQELAELQADVAALREEIRTWFAPGPNDVALFEAEEIGG